MKKKLLSLFLITSLAFALLPAGTVLGNDGDEEIQEAFGDINFLNAVREIIGKTNGEPIYRSDVENIEKLDIPNKKIASLDGIEYFTALRELDCFANEITSLDLSENPALEALECSCNLDLRFLDISKNTELEALYCDYDFPLKLNLENNVRLKALSCMESGCGKLDVSKNTELEYLDAHGCGLTELDVRSNPALEYLDCRFNYLESIEDVAGVENTKLEAGDTFMFTPQLPDNITGAFIDGRFLAAVRKKLYRPLGIIPFDALKDIKELDISGMGLTDLSGIEYFTSLETLDCSQNQLTSLDLSGNTALKSVNCENNLLTELYTPLGDSLLQLNCSNNRLTELDITHNPHIEQLYCYNNALDGVPDTMIKGLYNTDLGIAGEEGEGDNPFLYFPQLSGLEVNMLTVKKQDQTVNPNNTDGIEQTFRDENFLREVRKLIKKTNGEPIYKSDVENIVRLDLYSDKNISDLSGIEYFTGLKKLNCSHNYITELDLSYNTELEELACQYNPYLTALNVSKNTALKTLECGYSALAELDLTNNINLTLLGCEFTNIKTLDLSNNPKIDYIDVQNSELTAVDISNNQRLMYFDCAYNHLNSPMDITGLDECGAEVNGVFRFEPQRTEDITAVFKDGNMLAAVREAINKPDGVIYSSDLRNVIKLQLRNKNISDLSGIEYFTSLETLDCSQNRLTSLDLSGNTAIKTVNCEGNAISDINISGCGALSGIYCPDNLLNKLDIASNPCLRVLYCYDNDMGGSPYEAIDGLDNIDLGEAGIKNDVNKAFQYFPQRALPSNEYPYEINSVSLKSNDGRELDDIPQEESFIVNVSVTKRRERDVKDCIFAAYYNEQGGLIGINYISAKFAPGFDYEFGINIPKQSEKIGSIKVYICNSFNNLQPLCKSKGIKNN